jgi:hypothetical protein
MNIYEFKLLKNSAEPNDKELVDKLIVDNLYQYVDEVHFNKNKNNIYLSLLPEGYSRTNSKSIEVLPSNWSITISKLLEKLIVSINGIKSVKIGKVPATSSYYALPNNRDEFNKMFIDSSDADNPSVKNMDLFQRRILGTLSYYRISGTEYFPQVLPNNIQYLDMTDHQFSAYADVRAKERAMDDAQKRHSADVMSEKSSVYRAFSRMVCNFAFPEEIKRVFPQDIRKLMKQELGKDDDDYDSDEEELDKDAKKNLKKVKEEYDETLDKAIKNISTGDYLQRNKLSSMYSPKYAKMLEDVAESPGTVLIYSQFRMMEEVMLVPQQEHIQQQVEKLVLILH